MCSYSCPATDMRAPRPLEPLEFDSGWRIMNEMGHMEGEMPLAPQEAKFKNNSFNSLGVLLWLSSLSHM